MLIRINTYIIAYSRYASTFGNYSEWKQILWRNYKSLCAHSRWANKACRVPQCIKERQTSANTNTQLPRVALMAAPSLRAACANLSSRRYMLRCSNICAEKNVAPEPEPLYIYILGSPWSRTLTHGGWRRGAEFPMQLRRFARAVWKKFHANLEREYRVRELGRTEVKCERPMQPSRVLQTQRK